MFAGVLRFVPLARIKSPVRLPFFTWYQNGDCLASVSVRTSVFLMPTFKN